MIGGYALADSHENSSSLRGNPPSEPSRAFASRVIPEGVLRLGAVAGGGANGKYTTTMRAKRRPSHNLCVHVVTSCFRVCILAVLC